VYHNGGHGQRNGRGGIGEKIMATIAIKTNKRGIKYGMKQDGESFSVWKLCENYAPHCKGGMSQTWRYVEKGMTREAADKLFNRRAA
jgi:hypothetical protein